ncbi:hypothetical protein E2C01_049154 [Portunus trituberculatus]|uniref:Uncharacterized protein n=1 Tax=Portunus trituberculatus TaxID=210409 RepID=A0A5B7G8G1_PORTR|nr:hypothetical protein [Portunus trituberculatus]
MLKLEVEVEVEWSVVIRKCGDFAVRRSEGGGGEGFKDVVEWGGQHAHQGSGGKPKLQAGVIKGVAPTDL